MGLKKTLSLIPDLSSPVKGTAQSPQETMNQRTYTTVRDSLPVQLQRAPHSTSSQSTCLKAPGNSTYLSHTVRPSMGSWTVTLCFPPGASCCAPSCTLPPPVIGEVGDLFSRRMMKRCSGASPRGAWWSSRSPCLSRPWRMRDAPLLGAPWGSRGSSPPEKPLGMTTRPSCRSMLPALCESRSASEGWCSAPPRCWGRWRSLCSSRQHQQRGGASPAWEAPGSVEVPDP